MATPDIRNAYELLLRAVQQQALQQQGAGFGMAPNAVPEYNPYGDGGAQGGLFGRLQASTAEHAQQQPFTGITEQAPPELRDPNFRQLSRIPTGHLRQVAVTSANQSDNRPNSYSSTGYGTSFDPSGTKSSDVPRDRSVENSTPVQMAQFLLPGRALPIPPMGPGTIPQIPMPTIPDSWKAAASILHLFPNILLGLANKRHDEEKSGDNNVPPTADKKLGQSVAKQPQDPSDGDQKKSDADDQKNQDGSGAETGGGRQGGGGGGNGENWDRTNPLFDFYRRCVRASEKKDGYSWQEFCDDLPTGLDMRQRKAICYSNISQGQGAKRGFCDSLVAK